MEAKPVESLPGGKGWRYEPKWDGFRCLIFRDGGEIELQSKAERPLGRYFPEIVAAIAALRTERLVLDGELVIPQDGSLSFAALQMRLHPAESRIRKLAASTPARLILFDCVEIDGSPLLAASLDVRRRALERFHASERSSDFRVSPRTELLEEARDWLEGSGADLDGVIAKRGDEPYRPGERAMLKVKKLLSADCVVGGFRYGSKGREVGSLLLGLYNERGELDHVGFTSAIPAHDRAALTARLEKLAEPPGFTGRAPGGPSRWSTERSTEWVPLRSELVAEVRFDHVTGNRFRHGTKFLRWRPDKAPAQCRMEQLRPAALPADPLGQAEEAR